ncbi:MAG: Gldg family protein [Planctomycetes bacterium]|nr:Gldg family protein [Planctomycetota bacterium]
MSDWKAEEAKARDRVIPLLTLAITGLALFSAGLIIPFVKRDFYEVISGGVVQWRARPFPLVMTGVLLVLGIGCLLGASILGRGGERASPSVRRLLYGANTLVAGLFLVGILAFLNVLSNLRLGRFDVFNQTFDYTQASLYTLAPSTRDFISNLREPVNLYYFHSPFSGSSQFARAETATLVENCRRIQPSLVTWQVLEIPSESGLRELEDLRKKYQFPEELGLLVVMGTNHEFIKSSDLVSQQRSGPPGDPSGGATLQYLGEGKLLNALVYLSENKTKASVYLTSGNGEMGKGDGADRSAAMGQVIQALEKDSYKVETLNLAGKFQAIPADADIIVMAGPKNDPSQQAVDALEKFLQGGSSGKKGKLLVLLGPERERAGGAIGFTPLPRLKGLLRKFKVDVADQVVVNGELPPHSTTIAVANPRVSSSLTKPMRRGGGLLPFEFPEARVVSPVTAGPADAAAPSPLSADSFLIAFPRYDPRPVSDLSQSFEALVRSAGWESGKNPAPPTDELTVGVSVSDGGSPRLVVLGNARGFSDDFLGRRGVSGNAIDLASTSVNWLRERSNLGAKPSDMVKTERKTYKLELDQRAAGFSRLRFLPPALAVLAIAGMGAGVWLIRRR